MVIVNLRDKGDLYHARYTYCNKAACGRDHETRQAPVPDTDAHSHLNERVDVYIPRLSPLLPCHLLLLEPRPNNVVRQTELSTWNVRLFTIPSGLSALLSNVSVFDSPFNWSWLRYFHPGCRVGALVLFYHSHLVPFPHLHVSVNAPLASTNTKIPTPPRPNDYCIFAKGTQPNDVLHLFSLLGSLPSYHSLWR